MLQTPIYLHGLAHQFHEKLNALARRQIPSGRRYRQLSFPERSILTGGIRLRGHYMLFWNTPIATVGGEMADYMSSAAFFCRLVGYSSSLRPVTFAEF